MKAALCGSSYDTKIGVFSGVCGSLTCVAGNDDDLGPGGTGICDGGVVSSTSWMASEGITYYIYVTGFSSGTGSFDLTILCGDANAACSENGLVLELQTDAMAEQTSWEILPLDLDLPVCNGSGIPGEGIFTFTCCLPDDCYRLRVFDQAGDGIMNGGYILRTTDDMRIIDNRHNFSDGSTSAIANGEGFCLPIGQDRLIFTSCDKLDWVNDQFLVASLNAAVSAEWVAGAPNNQQDADSGYEFWFFDPNGSYSFRWFRGHNTSHGYGTGAARAAHLRINNWASAYHIPQHVLLNVRVRGVVEGEPLEWGPACRFMIDPVAAECPTTKLMDIPYNQFLSCGQYRTWDFNSFVHARPVSGATQYQFRFRQPAEGYEVVRTSNSYFTRLFWSEPLPPLVTGSQYMVDVRAYKNGQWCPWGEVCTLNIGTDMGQGAGQIPDLRSEINEPRMAPPHVTIWPNPNNGERLFLSLEDIGDGTDPVIVELFDMQGSRILGSSFSSSDEHMTTYLDLFGRMHAGVYVVSITVGDDQYIQRLVIQ